MKKQTRKKEDKKDELENKKGGKETGERDENDSNVSAVESGGEDNTDTHKGDEDNPKGVRDEKEEKGQTKKFGKEVSKVKTLDFKTKGGKKIKTPIPTGLDSEFNPANAVKAEPNEESEDKESEKSGEFDPEIYVLDEDGNPKKNKDGSYKKKRGRKKGQTKDSGKRQTATERKSNAARAAFIVPAANMSIVALSKTGYFQKDKLDKDEAQELKECFAEAYPDFLSDSPQSAFWFALIIILSSRSTFLN